MRFWGLNRRNISRWAYTAKTKKDVAQQCTNKRLHKDVQSKTPDEKVNRVLIKHDSKYFVEKRHTTPTIISLIIGNTAASLTAKDAISLRK